MLHDRLSAGFGRGTRTDFTPRISPPPGPPGGVRVWQWCRAKGSGNLGQPGSGSSLVPAFLAARGRTAQALKVHDHGGIVWDEFVGMWIVLGFFPQTYYGVMLCFVAFRLFDVWKPWPIDWIDECTPGGLGIMVDDVLAAVMALGVLWATELWLMPGLL